MQPLKIYDGPEFIKELVDQFPLVYWGLLEFLIINQGNYDIEPGDIYFLTEGFRLDNAQFLFDFLLTKGVEVRRVPGDRAYSVSGDSFYVSFRGHTLEEARAKAIINAFRRINTP